MSDKDTLICIGVITGVHGVRGDVVIRSFTQKPRDLLTYSPLYDESKKTVFHFKFKKEVKKGLVVHLDGINDRDTAETFRQTSLYIERKSLPPEDTEEFYFVDLEGLNILSLDGINVGTVQNVQDLGAGAYLDCVNLAGQMFSVPFLKKAVPEVCIQKGYLKVDSSFILKNYQDEKESPSK